MKPSDGPSASGKDRIIRHMNKDHSGAVARYVEYFCGVSRFASRNAKLVNIDLDGLAIRCGTKSYAVPLDPAMKDLSEARSRLVKLDHAAIHGLGRSPYTVKEYLPPRGIHAVIFATCFATFWMLSSPQHVMPGSIAFEVLLKHVPGLASLVQKLRLLILVTMIVVHSIEVFFMTSKLKKHSVPLFSLAWCMWVVSNFIEGVGAFQRIDAMVLEQQAAKGPETE